MVLRLSAFVSLAFAVAGGAVAARAQDTVTVDSTRAPAPAAPPSFIVRHAGKVTIGGELLARLPVDDPRQALHLVPGAVVRGAAVGLGATQTAIRGGGRGPAVFLDGAPVRLRTFGIQQLALSPLMVSEVSVEPGVANAGAGDAQGGVVAYLTPLGGGAYHGRIRAETDEALGNAAAVGYNRIEGAAGGPVPGLRNVTAFAAVQLQGQRSHYRGMGAAEQPSYVIGGLDTTVQLSDGSGNTITVPVPAFTQWSGDCDGCVGLRRPMDWSSHARVLGKLSYGGGASRVSLTALATGVQERHFPGTRIGAPSLYEGTHEWSRLVVLDAHHRFGDSARAGLTLRANLSWATDRAISGPLAAASELDTREPGLGIELAPLQFTGLEVFPFPVTEHIIRNFRTNTGLRVPYLDRNDLLNAQPYRLNPFGLQSGWPSQGLDAVITLASERRIHGRVAVEWTPLSGHRVIAGVEADGTTLSYYRSNLLRQAFADVLVLEPRASAVFVGDHLTLSDVTLDLGLRYDRITPGGEFADTPGRIYSNPVWNSMDYEASVAAVMTRARVQQAVSPRLRFTYRGDQGTTIVLGVGQYIEAPPYAELFLNSNADLSFINALAGFGRDLDFAKVTLVEAALAQELGDGVRVGVSGYRKTLGSPYAFRILPFDDPLNPGDTILFRALTRVDDGGAIGLEGHLAWDRGPGIATWAAYTLSASRPEELPGLAGPVNAPRVTTQQVSLVVSGAVPVGWKQGTAIGRAAAGVSGAAVFRAVSGVPYTRLDNQGAGWVAPGPLPLTQAQTVSQSSLPWGRHFDVRLTRRGRVGNLDWNVYADVRNIFGFRNAERVFMETGDVRNAEFEASLLSPEYNSLLNEAQANGALAAGNTVDVRGCGTWNDPVNCVALSRVERRFGNGDGLYTSAEQDRVLNTFYDAFAGPWWFYGPGGTARLGLEVTF